MEIIDIGENIIGIINLQDQYTNNRLIFHFDSTFDEMMEWLFDNTKGRFTFIGTTKIYFELSEDAMGFKLRWSC